MLKGLSGSLVSQHFAERILEVEFAGQLGEASAPQGRQRLLRLWHEQAAQLGPASGARTLWNQAAALAEVLGCVVQHVDAIGDGLRGALLTFEDARVGLVAGSWDDSPDTLWRSAVRFGIGLRQPWCICTNGRQLRLVDALRTYSRAYLQFDFPQAIEDTQTFSLFWAVLRSDAFRADSGEAPLVLRIVHASARHGQAVGRSLRLGVVQAVDHLFRGRLDSKGGRRRISDTDASPAMFDEALTVVYRVLFLMFAEARGLLPSGHSVYRDHYTIETLRDSIEHNALARGIWETLQAIARLAHRGCHAGTLVVPAFNGRFFSPARAPIAESCAVDAERARHALLALSTASIRGSRKRIDYRDLGIEQLGAVYESVLEYIPTTGGLVRGGDRRKATGSFYTPQSLTDYLVRRTLHPLVEHASAEQILRLRIVDPAMGSAAFLVAACRYLSFAYERALIRDGIRQESDVDEADRAGFRRQIAQRCPYGVDLNPTAVQLARLSLWLATLAAGKPLTFLDHRLACGDSLIGASPADFARQPPPGAAARCARSRGHVATPLFSDSDLEPSLARAVVERRWLAETGDDTPVIVREKERRLDRIARQGRWKALADLWCSCWMWPDQDTSPNQAVFASLVDRVRNGRSPLPERLSAPLLQQSCEIALSRRFFHWMAEFPEIYFDEAGRPLPNPGFDAVLGNPPWDMLRADKDGDKDNRFFRTAGIYRHQGGGHLNRYQLFVERAFTLTKAGGRVGLVLPSGFTTDHSSSSLRRRLLIHSAIDTLTGVDNYRAIFPIHRSVRFIICTSTVGRATQQIRCRFGIDDPAVLEAIPDAGDRDTDPAFPVTLTQSLIASFSSDRLTIPELRSVRDLAILEKIVHRFPRLGAEEGWRARFGRELNATDDRHHIHLGSHGLPVLEGKHNEPFRAHASLSRCRIHEKTAARLLDPARSFGRPRLAYRDVASATNRLSLIAAILPEGVVTTHSLFCLKSLLSEDDQAFLCGVLNSFVANYLVRQVVTTHLGSTTVEDLRVPRPASDSAEYRGIATLARGLGISPARGAEAQLQASVARCYGLDADDFRHILSTFPLIDSSDRAAALDAFLRGDAASRPY